jgi:hypothetical protein
MLSDDFIRWFCSYLIYIAVIFVSYWVCHSLSCVYLVLLCGLSLTPPPHEVKKSIYPSSPVILTTTLNTSYYFPYSLYITLSEILQVWTMSINCRIVGQVRVWYAVVTDLRWSARQAVYGLRLSPLGTAANVWPIVPTPCDRWWWVWSSRWIENWQGKRKYSEKTCLSVTLSTTNPTWSDPG